MLAIVAAIIFGVGFLLDLLNIDIPGGISGWPSAPGGNRHGQSRRPLQLAPYTTLTAVAKGSMNAPPRRGTGHHRPAISPLRLIVVGAEREPVAGLARRLVIPGQFCAETINSSERDIPAEYAAKDPKAAADAHLVVAPVSSSGVVRRRCVAVVMVEPGQ
jgi:hypothetical protein